MKEFSEYKETELLDGLMAEQRALGRISTYTGKPVTIIAEYSELNRSVKKIVDYLDQHGQLPITREGAKLVKIPNITQLTTDVRDLTDGGVCRPVVHRGVPYVILTDHGDKIIEEKDDVKTHN